MKSSSESDMRKIDDIQNLIEPESPLNVQFSSGTTGKPKAAVGSHFSALNNGINIGKLKC